MSRAATTGPTRSPPRIQFPSRIEPMEAHGLGGIRRGKTLPRMLREINWPPLLRKPGSNFAKWHRFSVAVYPKGLDPREGATETS